MNQPNLILIMTDQLRWDCSGYAGHPDVKTPYLDTLGLTGVAFGRSYSTCPSCIAARAALHTGMSQEHHKRVGYLDGIPWNYEHTLAGELSKSGLLYPVCRQNARSSPAELSWFSSRRTSRRIFRLRPPDRYSLPGIPTGS